MPHLQSAHCRSFQEKTAPRGSILLSPLPPFHSQFTARIAKLLQFPHRRLDERLHTLYASWLTLSGVLIYVFLEFYMTRGKVFGGVDIGGTKTAVVLSSQPP